MTLDLAELRRLAEAATRDGWEVPDSGDGTFATFGDHGCAFAVNADDARYIAAANPATVLALLEMVEEKRANEACDVAQARIAELEAGLREACYLYGRLRTSSNRQRIADLRCLAGGGA